MQFNKAKQFILDNPDLDDSEIAKKIDKPMDWVPILRQHAHAERSKQQKLFGHGKWVAYCGHDAEFSADVMQIGDAVVVRANGPITERREETEEEDEGGNLFRPIENATAHVSDHLGGFWRPDLGVFVVPAEAYTLYPPAK